MLILDFDIVERGIAAGLAERESWRAAFGLTVSLVWIYTKLLRILAILRGDYPPQLDDQHQREPRDLGPGPAASSGARARRLGAPRAASASGWRPSAVPQLAPSGPRAPRRAPATSVPSTSVPGVLDRLGRRPAAIGRIALAAARPRASVLVVGPRPSAASDRRQQHRGQRRSRRPTGGSGRARTAAPGRRRTPGRARAERDGAAARLDDRDRLRGGEPARPEPRDLLERRRRAARPCPGRGRCRRPPRRRPRAAGGRRRRAAAPTPTAARAWVTSLAPIRMTATSGSAVQRLVDLAVEVARSARRPRRRERRWTRRSAPVGEPGGQQRAGRLLDAVDAVARGAGVAEQRDLERRRRCGRGRTSRSASGGSPSALPIAPAGQRGLGAQHAVERSRRATDSPPPP